MSYPEQINSLHFQYKTAFDAVKSCTDKNDEEITQIILELKSTKDKPKKSQVPDKEPKTMEPKTKEPKTKEPKTKEPKTKEPTVEPKTKEPTVKAKEPTKKTTKKPKVTKPTDDAELQLEP